jgi:hypothetical protein
MQADCPFYWMGGWTPQNSDAFVAFIVDPHHNAPPFGLFEPAPAGAALADAPLADAPLADAPLADAAVTDAPLDPALDAALVDVGLLPAGLPHAAAQTGTDLLDVVAESDQEWIDRFPICNESVPCSSEEDGVVERNSLYVKPKRAKGHLYPALFVQAVRDGWRGANLAVEPRC